MHVPYISSRWCGLCVQHIPCHIHRGHGTGMGHWGLGHLLLVSIVCILLGRNVYSSYVEPCQEPADLVRWDTVATLVSSSCCKCNCHLWLKTRYLQHCKPLCLKVFLRCWNFPLKLSVSLMCQHISVKGDGGYWHVGRDLYVWVSCGLNALMSH